MFENNKTWVSQRAWICNKSVQQIIALLRETSFPKYLAYQYALVESYRWKKQIDFASLTPSLICKFLSFLKTYKCLFNYRSAGKVFLYTYIQQRKTKRTFFAYLAMHQFLLDACMFFTFYHHYPHYHENKIYVTREYYVAMNQLQKR